MKKISVIIICFICWISSGVQAQTKVQVLTKTISKTFDASHTKLNVHADMADIQVSTWSQNQIGVTVKLISRHADIETARKDLDKIKFLDSKLNKELYLRNYVALDKNDAKPSSNLKAIYYISVPVNLPMFISDRLGKVEVIGTGGQVDIKGEFTEIIARECNATVNIDAYYGEVIAEKLATDINIKSNRSKIRIDELSGKGYVNAEYATLDVRSGDQLKSMSIYLKYSNVNFTDDTNGGYNFDLLAENGKINHPKQMLFKITRNDSRYFAHYYGSKENPTINITTTFGDITISR